MTERSWTAFDETETITDHEVTSLNMLAEMAVEYGGSAEVKLSDGSGDVIRLTTVFEHRGQLLGIIVTPARNPSDVNVKFVADGGWDDCGAEAQHSMSGEMVRCSLPLGHYPDSMHRWYGPAGTYMEWNGPGPDLALSHVCALNACCSACHRHTMPHVGCILR